jgi:citrate lyase beta subunit
MSTDTHALSQEARDVLDMLRGSNAAFAKVYPGDRPDRQPVHSVYGGAQLFKAELPTKLGRVALGALREFAPTPFVLARAVGLAGAETLPESSEALDDLRKRYREDPISLRETAFPAWLALTVYDRVEAKLEREPVEDFRIDFEDGFGVRPDAEEDAEVERTAKEVAKAMAAKTLPPFIGIRIKTLNEELKERSFRTLEGFVATLLAESGGKLPETFVVTLPKVTHVDQVKATVRMLELLEARHALAEGALQLELMIEVTQTLFDREGRFYIPILHEACRGRCFAAHFGTYDYTASCNITASHQAMDHGNCDFARNLMTIGFGGTGVFLSDGATNVMPVGPHKATPEAPLTDEQAAENHDVVHRAWKLAFDHTQHSLRHGIYQGWDLHPAQLVVRYAACYAFFLEGFAPAAKRLQNFVSKAAQATLVGDVFDDAATGQGLLNYFLRALNCGAVAMEDLHETGLTVEEVQLRSFGKILDARRQRMQASRAAP